jgi:hypothetical protein
MLLEEPWSPRGNLRLAGKTGEAESRDGDEDGNGGLFWREPYVRFMILDMVDEVQEELKWSRLVWLMWTRPSHD